MRSARVKLNGAVSVAAIFGVCVFALASVIVIGVVDASDPVPQASQPKTDSSAAKVDIKSKSSLDALSKDKRKGKDFQNRRKVVLDFVGQHFPELQKSLLKSEKKSPGKFRNAISRLEKGIIRLQKFEQKNPPKFELLVDLWKLKTRIEITLAKYANKESNSQLDERLRPLVEQTLGIRTSIAELDRQSAAKRISNVEKRLLHFENDRERIIKNQLSSFQKSADKIRAKKQRKLIQRQSQNAAKAEPNTVNQPSKEKEKP